MIEWLKQFIKRHKRLIQGLISLFFLTILIRRSDVGELWGYLSNAPLAYLIPWLIFHDLVVVFLGGNGIYLLLRRLRGGGYWQIITTSYKLHVLATVIPGRLGDLSLPYFLKDFYTLGQSAAVLLVDKIITLSLTSILAGIGLGIIFSWSYFAIVVLTMFVGLGFFIWLLRRDSKRVRRWVRTRLLRSLSDRFSDFHSEIVATATDIRGIAGNLFLTFTRAVLAGISFTLILFWFGEKVDLWYVILVQAIAQLVTMIPLTARGIGVTETVFVTLLGQVGVELEVVLAVSFSSTAIYLVFIFLLFLIWIRNPLSKQS